MVLELQVNLLRGPKHMPAHLSVLLILPHIQFGGRPALLDGVDLLLYFKLVDGTDDDFVDVFTILRKLHAEDLA